MHFTYVTRAAGVGIGDEVIVPAHTFVATCSVVSNGGANPSNSRCSEGL